MRDGRARSWEEKSEAKISPWWHVEGPAHASLRERTLERDVALARRGNSGKEDGVAHATPDEEQRDRAPIDESIHRFLQLRDARHTPIPLRGASDRCALTRRQVEER